MRYYFYKFTTAFCQSEKIIPSNSFIYWRGKVMPNDILIINSSILPLASGMPELIPNGYLSIKNGEIMALGTMDDLAAARGATNPVARHDQLSWRSEFCRSDSWNVRG